MDSLNKLTLINRVDGSNTLGLFKCECGVEKIINISDVKRNNNKSCGCANRLSRIKNLQLTDNVRHGHARRKMKSPTYVSWISMTNRGLLPRLGYIERGILVCDRWRIYENFLEDMGERPKGTTIERLDNDKGYYKENCSWEPMKVQNRNKSDTIYIVVGGKKVKFIDIYENSGSDINKGTVRTRLKMGWDLEDALTRKPLKRGW